jgi:uncharacterized protein YqgC (DUF456 family)
LAVIFDMIKMSLLLSVCILVVSGFVYLIDYNEPFSQTMPIPPLISYMLISVVIILLITGSIAVSYNNRNYNSGPVSKIEIIIYVIIGIFIAIVAAVLYIDDIITKHKRIIWLQQEARTYRVKDFTDREHEIPPL